MFLSADELRQFILDALNGHTVLSIATQGRGGIHAVSLMYAHRAFDIYWLSDPKSSHSVHLADNGRCAVTIARQQDQFQSVRGLQLSGRGCELIPGAEADEGFRALTERYEFLQKPPAGDLARHLGRAAVYRFRAEQITLIDNSRGFGFKQVLKL